MSLKSFEEEKLDVDKSKSEKTEQDALDQTTTSTKHLLNENKLEDSFCFLVYFKGQIIGANFPNIDHIYCKYNFVFGPDWHVLNGNQEGFSQIASKNRFSKNQFNTSLFTYDKFKSEHQISNVWNLPFELTMSSTNVYGWPQIAISVYGLNFFGLDLVQGYGHLHLPPIPGNHELCLNLFRPKSSTLLGELSEYLGGKRPEFLNFKLVAKGQGRDMFRLNSVKGKIIIHVEVITKDLNKHGYTYV